MLGAQKKPPEGGFCCSKRLPGGAAGDRLWLASLPLSAS
jgi:hypothetical protein